MALDIVGATKRSTIAEEDLPLFQMLKDFNLQAPQFELIWEKFYNDPCVDTSIWLREIYELRNAYLEKFIREKRVQVKDPEVREQVLATLLQNDRWIMKFDELIAVCEDAIAHSQALQFLSD